MSQITYNKQWAQANAELTRIINLERPKKNKPFSSDREICFNELSVRYIKFIAIYKQLQECYDHMIHPQKRILVVRCLDGVAGRIVELLTELVRLRINEYINLVDVCLDLKILPEHLELTLCKATYINRVSDLRQRADILDYILESMNDEDEEAVTEKFFTVSEAILLIQRNERAFRARRRADAVKKRKAMLRRLQKTKDMKDTPSMSGIIKFQALWRRYRIRKAIGSIRRENDIFLGMTMPVYRDLRVIDKKIEMADFEKAQINDDFMKKDIIVKTELYMDSHAAPMAENMKREIMQWILEYRDLIGSFPQFPSEEEGGSLALFSNKTLKQLEEDLEELNEAAKSKSSGKGNGKSIEKGKENGKDKEKEKDKKKDAQKGPRPFEPKPSRFIDEELIPCVIEYSKYWMYNIDADNRKQRYDKTLLMEDIQANVEIVIRKQVDELIREELMRLEKGIDFMKPAKPKAKKDKQKKGGGKKKKGAKDPTAGVPMEDLFKELVLACVIKRAPNVKLQMFLGTTNLMSPTDTEAMEFKHDLGDVRKMIFDYAILPMSSEVIHRRAPYRKSIIIVGPRGSGKRMLVHAICTELGANLIDLSPDNIADKYEGKDGQKRLIHLVTKVGKQLEPTVIHIADCDRMFTKKLPPEDTTNPARLKGDLMKLLKGITPDDRILIVGTTSYPFKAAITPMFKLYERLVFIYPPSSSSRFALWKKFITEFKGIFHANFDLSSLVTVSQGYTAGAIRHAVMEVLTSKRQKRQGGWPLNTKEFIKRLSTFDPVFEEELAEFERWLIKTPMKKKYNKIHLLEAQGEDVTSLL